MADLQRRVVCLVVVRDAHVLLQLMSKAVDDTPYGGLWELPQGKVEAGESLQEAASRELCEETGLTLVEVLSGQIVRTAYREAASNLSVYKPTICVVDSLQKRRGGKPEQPSGLGLGVHLTFEDCQDRHAA